MKKFFQKISNWLAHEGWIDNWELQKIQNRARIQREREKKYEALNDRIHDLNAEVTRLEKQLIPLDKRKKEARDLKSTIQQKLRVIQELQHKLNSID